MLFLMFFIGFFIGLILSKYLYARVHSKVLSVKPESQNNLTFWRVHNREIAGFIIAGFLIMFIDNSINIGLCFIGIGVGIFIYFSLYVRGFLKIKNK